MAHRFSVAVLTLIFFAAGVHGQGRPIALEAFLRDAVPEWDRVAEFDRNTPAYTLTSRANSDLALSSGVVLPAGATVRTVSSAAGRYLSVPDGRIPQARVVGLNGDYYFELTPSSRAPDRWVLSRVERVYDAKDAARRQADLRRLDANTLITINHIPLKVLLKDRRFTAVELEREGRLYRLRYRYDLAAGFPYNGVSPIESGTLWFDPDHHYGVRRSVTVTKSGSTVVKHEFVHELTKLPDGASYVSGMRHLIEDQPVADALYSARLDSPPASDFYLSHFGLPEPDWYVQRRNTNRYLWLGFAAGAFVLGWLAWRLKRKANR